MACQPVRTAHTPGGRRRHCAIARSGRTCLGHTVKMLGHIITMRTYAPFTTPLLPFNEWCTTPVPTSHSMMPPSPPPLLLVTQNADMGTHVIEGLLEGFRFPGGLAVVTTGCHPILVNKFSLVYIVCLLRTKINSREGPRDRHCGVLVVAVAAAGGGGGGGVVVGAGIFTLLHFKRFARTSAHKNTGFPLLRASHTQRGLGAAAVARARPPSSFRVRLFRAVILYIPPKNKDTAVDAKAIVTYGMLKSGSGTSTCKYARARAVELMRAAPHNGARTLVRTHARCELTSRLSA
jgi:hypothetical protein